MPKVKPERIAGIVALTYLVLIPTGALVAFLKIREIDRDVTAMWNHMNMPDSSKSDNPFSLASVRNFLR